MISILSADSGRNAHPKRLNPFSTLLESILKLVNQSNEAPAVREEGGTPQHRGALQDGADAIASGEKEEPECDRLAEALFADGGRVNASAVVGLVFSSVFKTEIRPALDAVAEAETLAALRQRGFLRGELGGPAVFEDGDTRKCPVFRPPPGLESLLEAHRGTGNDAEGCAERSQNPFRLPHRRAGERDHLQMLLLGSPLPKASADNQRSGSVGVAIKKSAACRPCVETASTGYASQRTAATTAPPSGSCGTVVSLLFAALGLERWMWWSLS
jgi:hypothetical protein